MRRFLTQKRFSSTANQFYRDDKFLQGKVALVTGSTSGIGFSLAQALASKGASVMLNGFGDPDVIAQAQKDIADAYQVKILYNGADLSCPKQSKEMIEDCVARLGSIDILCNNAGIQHTAPVDEFPEEMWDKLLAIHLSSPFHTIKAALPHMKKNNWGRIINTASVHGLVGSVNKSAYVAAKHGVVGLTKVVALETAETGITCNSIAPGWVLTPLVQAQIEERAKRLGMTVEEATIDLLKEKTPSKKMVTPEQLGGLVLFLCSPSADQIRGQTFPVDGAWTAV